MSDSKIDFDITLEQYHLYQDLLKQTSFLRSISNYFFITINVVIILAGYFSFPMKFENISIFSALSLIGIILCIYWMQETRELYIQHELRFRILMELESNIVKSGLLSKEWEHLGDFKFRRSPVLFISLSRQLPFIFLLLHVSILSIFTIAWVT